MRGAVRRSRRGRQALRDDHGRRAVACRSARQGGRARRGTGAAALAGRRGLWRRAACRVRASCEHPYGRAARRSVRPGQDEQNRRGVVSVRRLPQAAGGVDTVDEHVATRLQAGRVEMLPIAPGLVDVPPADRDPFLDGEDAPIAGAAVGVEDRSGRLAGKPPVRLGVDAVARAGSRSSRRERRAGSRTRAVARTT